MVSKGSRCRKGVNQRTKKCRTVKKKPTPSGQRQRVCRKTKSGDTKCVYVTRDKKGQITDVQNIGRATRRDAATKAKRTVRKPGRGNRGDY